MLPQKIPDVAVLVIAARSLPAESTGGDFYDFLCLSDGSLGVAIGDASGHGLSAALVVAAARAYLREGSDNFDESNELLLEDLPERRFVTLFWVA